MQLPEYAINVPVVPNQGVRRGILRDSATYGSSLGSGSQYNVSQIPCIACEIGKQACYVSPVPDFVCDLGYNLCRSNCS